MDSGAVEKANRKSASKGKGIEGTWRRVVKGIFHIHQKIKWSFHNSQNFKYIFHQNKEFSFLF